MSDDLPSAKRMEYEELPSAIRFWELAAKAVEFECTREDCRRYETAKAISKLSPQEQRVFEGCLDYDGAIAYEEAKEDLRSGLYPSQENASPSLARAGCVEGIDFERPTPLVEDWLQSAWRGIEDKQQMHEMETTNIERNTEMNDELLRAGYDAQKLRIDALESWIEQAISRPAMSRELRLQGLELVEARSPDVRLAVERICPQRPQGLEHSLEIER